MADGTLNNPVKKMATSSFYEMMIIDTPEKSANPNAAYQDYLKRGPLVFNGPDLIEDG